MTAFKGSEYNMDRILLPQRFTLLGAACLHLASKTPVYFLAAS